MTEYELEPIGPIKHPLTRDQVKWANKHDWFLADNCDGSIWVAEYGWDKDGNADNKIILWDKGFKALKTWAGY